MGTVLQNIVEKKHYKFIDGEGVTWQEAIRLSTLSLVADGTVTEDFYKQIIACVEKYGPYIVFEHNIAMPHPQENAYGALKTGVGFMVSKKLIDFGTDEDGEEKKANVFFTLSTTNPDEHLENISQLSTAYWLIMFALPQLLNNNVAMMVVMAVILGAYWAVGSNLTVKPMQELSEGAGFAVYLAILQLGVRTFVTELTASFQGIADKLPERAPQISPGLP